MSAPVAPAPAPAPATVVPASTAVSAPTVSPAKPTPAVPAKRPLEEDKENEEEGRLFDWYEEPKWNCNQIRNKCHAYVDSGAMKVTHFQKKLGVNSNAWRNFMAQNGPYSGVNSSVYMAGYIFFRNMEIRGEKMPKKAKLDTTDTVGDKKAKKGGLTDFGDLKLPGEDEGDVKVFDCCDEIRKKINAYLPQPGVTQSGFLKDVAAAANVKGFQAKQLNDFRSYKGPHAGNTSGLYYGAYVFFEKMRIRDGKAKSAQRVKWEDALGEDGFDRKSKMRGMWVPMR